MTKDELRQIIWEALSTAAFIAKNPKEFQGFGVDQLATLVTKNIWDGTRCTTPHDPFANKIDPRGYPD